MTFTGIVRGVDRLGRIVLPKKMRIAMGISGLTDPIEIFVSEGGIVLKKANMQEGVSGEIRCLDKFGRIVIPKEVRNLFDIKSQIDSLEIYCEEDTIILKKYQPTCIFCGGNEGLITFKDKKICTLCINEIKK
ncbi:MAG: AbrB/MazE/SpoVT family DNA-binding domain-containing protein [Clostridia bacterium]|nr:AbrB/MazE/SpoVT family DNA-binding domain-containing protein [Clostridia bacterium]